MLYGGTSAGWLAVPFLGTSYDYSAPIAEDRSLRDSFYELKNLALFTRVAYDLRMTDRLVSGTNYTTNSSVLTTILRNPATGAGFYIVRHDDSTDSTQITFKIEVDTSLGNLTIPAHAPGMSLSGHNAKILVTDFDIGGHSSIIYSTAEVLTYSIMDGETTLVLWTPTGETGEAYITGASNGKLLTGPAKVKFHQADKGVIIGFTQSADMMIAQVGNVKILLVDQKVAHSIFVPALSPDPHVPVNDTGEHALYPLSFIHRVPNLSDLMFT
jgi:beta-galactosidase